MAGNVSLAHGESFPRPPLVGITIAIQDEKGKRYETVTNDAGEFEFTGLKPGKYLVEPVWEDYYSVSEPKRKVVIADRGCVTVNYWVKVEGSISGRVMDTEKRPDDETEIHSQRGKGAPDGKFVLEGIPPGLYLLYGYNPTNVTKVSWGFDEVQGG